MPNSIKKYISSESDLYDRIKKGEEIAFEQFFRKYYPRLKAFAVRLTMNGDLAEDLVQDIFLSLWENHQNIDPNKSLKSWFFLSLRNNCLNYLRKQKTEQRYLDFLSFQNKSQELFLDSSMEEWEIEALKNKQINQIAGIIETLPPQCRKVFEMSRFKKIKNHEIAQELGISVRTVETHISQAIKVINKQMKSKSVLLMLAILLLFN